MRVTFLLTALTMLAFAANSVLCRLALGGLLIDAASFTTVRLASGTLMLWLLVLLQRRRTSSGNPAPRKNGAEKSSAGKSGASYVSAFALFAYAICFSLAYRQLSTASGALLLFGCVQLTMIGWGLWRGERPRPLAALGMLLALGGLVYLSWPGVTAPPLLAAVMMAIAGFAWGVYSLRGRRVRQPLTANAVHFSWALPLALLVSAVSAGSRLWTPNGVLLAVLSGALASGVGYALWYRVLPHLAAIRAATVQLSVPVLAAILGAVVVGEPVTARVVVAGMLILGGIALEIRGRGKVGVPGGDQPESS